MSVQQLRALADIRLAELSPIAAANIAPSGGGVPQSVNLALRAATVDPGSDPRWAAAERDERRALNRLHELLDEAEGHGVAVPDRELTGEQMDAEIVAEQNAHLSAVQFAQEHPGYGSPSTISRKRRWFRAGRCTMNGLEPRHGCQCPTCRAALI